jgi:ribose transport system permease protein
MFERFARAAHKALRTVWKLVEWPIRWWSRLSEVMQQVLIMTALLAVLLGVLRWSNANAFEAGNLQSLSRDVAIHSLLALGLAVVLISGGIDLSVGSIVCFVGLNAILLLAPTDPQQQPWPLAVVMPLMLLFATAVGVVHGLLVCLMRLPPFMVTLCSLLVLRSLARGMNNDTTASYREKAVEAFHWLGNDTWLGVPMPVFIMLAALAGLAFFMHLTVHGRYLYAIGYNLEAARFSGVRVHRLRIAAYAICAFLAGLAGLLEASKVHSVAPSSAGMTYELYAITAAVLGGCALRGGHGSLVGAMIGVAVLKVLEKVIVFVGLRTHYTDAVIGFVLLAAVIADALVKRRRGH